MVQVVDNWADVTGVVHSVHDSAVPDHVRVRLDLTGAIDVETKPNFFRNKVGSAIDVQVRLSAIPPGLLPGNRVALRVRATGPDEAFASGDGLRALD